MERKRKEIMLLIELFDLELSATLVNGKIKTFDPPLTKEEISKKIKQKGGENT